MDNVSTEHPFLLTRSRIKHTLRYLKKKRILIFAAVVFGAVMGIIYCSVKKPLYTATLTFSLEDEDKLGGSSLISIASQFGLDIGQNAGSIFTGDNIIELFKSRRMVEQTLLQPYNNGSQSFADEYLDFSGIRERTDLPQNFFPAHASNLTRVQDSIMGKTYDYFSKALLDIQKRDKRLNIYEVTFKITNEQFAKLFTQTLVQQVSDFYTATKTKRAKLNVNILQSRVDSIRNVYNMALYGKASLLDANLNPTFQESQVGVQKKQTDITVMGTAYAELLKNLELAKYTLLKQTPFMQVIDEPIYPLKKKTYSAFLYIPLSICFFTFLAVISLIVIKLLKNTITYFS